MISNIFGLTCYTCNPTVNGCLNIKGISTKTCSSTLYDSCLVSLKIFSHLSFNFNSPIKKCRHFQ